MLIEASVVRCSLIASDSGEIRRPADAGVVVGEGDANRLGRAP